MPARGRRSTGRPRHRDGNLPAERFCHNALSAGFWGHNGCGFALAKPASMPKLCNMLQSRRVQVRAKADCRLPEVFQLSSTFKVFAAIFITVSLLFAQEKPVGDTNVKRATLENGLRVVIVRDPLAPVVTVEQNYVVGANETPDGFPGMAHAQEHMALRGCGGVNAG